MVSRAPEIARCLIHGVILFTLSGVWKGVMAVFC